MKTLVFTADIILPNITEACFLTNSEYRDIYDRKYIEDIISKLSASGAKTIILTGVGFKEDTTGVIIYESGSLKYYEHKKISKGSHGTGDIYASAFTGAFLRGKTAYESAVIAADYTVKCIENTVDDPDHWYGVKFEPVLPSYIDAIK